MEEMIQPGNLCSPSSSSPFDLWIHAAEETPRPNDVARVRKKYADVNHHWPKTLPTNCVLGRVTVYRILSGAMFLREGGYQLHPPSLQREVFGNNVLVIGNARRLVLPLPHPAPFPSKRGGIWSLPAKLRHSAMQQQPRLSECVHVLTSSEGRGDQERRMLFDVTKDASVVVKQGMRGGGGRGDGDGEEFSVAFPTESEQKASRRCAPEFWRIDTTAMSNPLSVDARRSRSSSGEQKRRKEEGKRENKRENEVSEDPRPVVVLLRQDLRVHDNPALYEASALHAAASVHVVYIHPPKSECGGWPIVGAAKVWLHHALVDVDASLRTLGRSGNSNSQQRGRAKGPREGASGDARKDAGESTGLICLDASSSTTEMVLFNYLLEIGAGAVYWNDLCEPWKHARDTNIASSLRANGIKVRTFKAVVLFAPWEARPDERPECMKIGFGSVGFFRRACSELEPPGDPLPVPSSLRLPWGSSGATKRNERNVHTLRLLHYPIKRGRGGKGGGGGGGGRGGHSSKTAWLESSRESLGKSCRFCRIRHGLKVPCCHKDGEQINWSVGITNFWTMTEKGALSSLDSFLKENNGSRMKSFDSNERHRADKKSTAVISPYVRFGQLSPRYIVHQAKKEYGHRVRNFSLLWTILFILLIDL